MRSQRQVAGSGRRRARRPCAHLADRPRDDHRKVHARRMGGRLRDRRRRTRQEGRVGEPIPPDMGRRGRHAVGGALHLFGGRCGIHPRGRLCDRHSAGLEPVAQSRRPRRAERRGQEQRFGRWPDARPRSDGDAQRRLCGCGQGERRPEAGDGQRLVHEERYADRRRLC